MKIFKSNRIFKTILISYLTILLVPIVILTGSFMIIFGGYKTGVTATNEAVIKQLQSVIDTKLDIINTFSQRIALNPYFSDILKMDSPFSTDDIYAIQRIVRDVYLSVPLQEGLIDDYYIYMPSSHYVIVTDGILKGEMFYPHIYNYTGMSHDEWLFTMNNMKNIFSYEHKKALNNTGKTTDIILVIQSIPINIVDMAEPKLVMHLNANFLKELVRRDDNTYTDNTLIIADNQNNIMFSNHNINPAILSLIGGRSGEISYKNSKYTYLVSPTSVIDFKYVALFSQNKLNNNLLFVQYVMVCSIILIIILGLILGYLFTKKNYKPIKNILEIFGFKGATSKNEYQVIQENIYGVLNERETLKDEMLKNLPSIKGMLYNKFLTGAIDAQTDEILNEFRYPLYSVVLFEVDFRDNMPVSLFSHIVQTIEDSRQVNEWVVNLSKGTFCVISGYGHIVESDTRELINRVQAIAQNMDIQITTAVSDVVKGVENIPPAYEHVKKTIKHKLVKGIGSIIYSQDVLHENYEEGYYYPIDKEIQLINCIKISDMDSALDILNSIIDENFKRRRLSIEMANCVVFNIISTINKVFWEMKIETLTILDQNPIQRLVGCQSVQEVYDCVREFLTSIHRYLDQVHQSRNRELKTRIKEYIHSNYQSHDMSLSSVAEEININPSYLSRYFKEQFGENFIDYMARLRVDISKKLLSETDMKIQDIAQLVGYASANNFIRVFKKQEGVSPNKYREKIHSGL